ARARSSNSQQWGIAPMMNRGILQTTLMVALLASPVLAKKKPTNQKAIVWETGHVVAQNYYTQNNGTYVGSLPGGVIGIPLTSNQNLVVIDVGSLRYTWAEKGRNRLIFTTNADTSFYRDGDYFVVPDIKGKKHRFYIVASEQR